MRVAVVADLHANIHAVDAVSRRLDELGPDRVLCAGDLVGYNAHPAEVLAWTRDRVDVAVAGNHDVDVVTRKPGMGTTSSALRGQDWTREQLVASDLAFLDNLPWHVEDDCGLHLAHGCYLNSRYYTGYVTSTMIPANLEALDGRGDGQVRAVCGHTHIPFVAWLIDGAVVYRPQVEACHWPRRADAVLINPGSVGQPRDGDPRACFALVDVAQRSVVLHRVSYDVDAACRSIAEVGLPDDSATRLHSGR